MDCRLLPPIGSEAAKTGAATRSTASLLNGAKCRASRRLLDHQTHLQLAQPLVGLLHSAACSQAEAISASWCCCTTRVPKAATTRQRGSRFS